MRHPRREPRSLRGNRYSSAIDRNFRREDLRSDWYERDEMDERSGYRDEDYRPSSEFRDTPDYRREERPQFAGRGPKSYKRSDDRIREDVCEMLTRDNDVDAYGIDVEVKNGEVTLSGTVPDRRMKHLAEDCAEGCYGVKNVINNIRVDRDAVI